MTILSKISWFAGLASIILITAVCSRQQVAETGQIHFTVNGEDLVRRGFTEKQGWQLAFQALYINLVDPIAYHSEGQSLLSGSYWVDLADPKAQGPIKIGSTTAKPGNYQSLRFSLGRTTAGPYPGFSIVLIGTAERGEQRLPFTILFDEEMDFDGREGYVGEEIKGLLKPGGSTSVEMTFHFDHLFGVNQDDPINAGALGFDYFAGFVRNGSVRVEQSEMMLSEDYPKLLEALWTLGHLGEGHCRVSGQSSKP